jgi:hypothetical protein
MLDALIMMEQDYDFFVVNDGIDLRNSMLRQKRRHRRRSSAAQRAAQIEQRARRRSTGAELPPGEATSLTIGSTNEEQCLEISQSTATRDLAKATNVAEMSKNHTRTLAANALSPSGQSDQPRKNFSPVSPGGMAEPVDDEMTDLASSMSALKFVPASIRFGRGRGKTGFSNR